MAIKQRALRYIRQTKKLLTASDSAVLLPEALTSLKQAAETLSKGLAPCYYAEYQEVMAGVSLALERLASGIDVGEGREILSMSLELLTFVEKRTAEETHFKKEIVFLPYKAAMWDSLESVWQAVTNDEERAIAYVVPIPYFDRAADGTVQEWHCETGKFPRYVPVVDYRKIDLANMHPDVIVIHNPYDDYNNVTSVDSKYYSRNLKQWTDKLVYIPYFVLEEVDLDNEKAMENVANFIFHGRGVINADLTIVQSENMREAYIRLLTKHTDKDRAYWEKRILGLGSPKFDKLLSTKREDIRLPAEWRRVIEKPDGTRKKVILYNASLNNLGEYREKLLDKMEWVFKTFRERQDEVALLWRPHPLFAATIKAHMPELWKRYSSMVERYKSEGWGIYDDSADVDRAVVVSDGYYGDASSLVEMFRVARKPQLMQDINYTLSLVSETTLAVRDYVRVGDKLYFVPLDAGLLCEYSFSSGTVSVLCEDGWTKLRGSKPYSRYSCAIESQGRIYILPLQRRNVFCFDLHNREKLPDVALNSHIQGTYGAVQYQDYIYMFADQGGDSFRLDLHNNKSEKLTALANVMFSICNSVCSVGNLAYIPMIERGKIMCFDMANNDYQVYTVPDCDMVIALAVYAEDRLFLSGDSPFIIECFWDADGCYIKNRYEIPKEYVRGHCDSPYMFVSGIYFHKALYFSPLKANGIIKLDLATGELSRLIEAPLQASGYVIHLWNDKYLFCGFGVTRQRKWVKSVVFDENGKMVQTNPFNIMEAELRRANLTFDFKVESRIYTPVVMTSDSVGHGDDENMYHFTAGETIYQYMMAV